LGLPSEVHGVVVTNIDPESPAASVLQQGDVIESIDRQPVRNVEEFNRLAAQVKGRTLLRINRQGMGMFVVISQ
jgi:S1-C subfamily serine protease